MVTSPYEWKILEWDDKLQTNKKKQNKQTNNRKTYFLFSAMKSTYMIVFIIDITF